MEAILAASFHTAAPASSLTSTSASSKCHYTYYISIKISCRVKAISLTKLYDSFSIRQLLSQVDSLRVFIVHSKSFSTIPRWKQSPPKCEFRLTSTSKTGIYQKQILSLNYIVFLSIFLSSCRIAKYFDQILSGGSSAGNNEEQLWALLQEAMFLFRHATQKNLF
jgi:hypothetical protein